MNVTDIWKALLLCQIDLYVGPPDNIKHGTGKNFISKAIQSQAHVFNINTAEVPIEEINKISIVEIYRKPFRRSCSISKREAPDTNHKDALKMAAKCTNGPIGAHGLVTILLVPLDSQLWSIP